MTPTGKKMLFGRATLTGFHPLDEDLPRFRAVGRSQDPFFFHPIDQTRRAVVTYAEPSLYHRNRSLLGVSNKSNGLVVYFVVKVFSIIHQIIFLGLQECMLIVVINALIFDVLYNIFDFIVRYKGSMDADGPCRSWWQKKHVTVSKKFFCAN